MSREEKLTMVALGPLLLCGIWGSIALSNAGHPWVAVLVAVVMCVCIVGVGLRLTVLARRARAVQALLHQHPSHAPEDR